MVRKRVFFSGGASCLAANVAAISSNDDHRVFANDRNGEPLCTQRTDSEDAANLEMDELGKAISGCGKWATFSNGARCLVALIDGVTPTNDHRILVKSRSGAVLCSVKCNSTEEVEQELRLFNQQI